MGLSGAPFLRWERVGYSNGSSLTGWETAGGGTTGWSISSGYAKTSGTSLDLSLAVAQTCTTLAAPSGYPQKPAISPLMYFSCKARWPSGGSSGKSTELIMATEGSGTPYNTGLQLFDAAQVGFLLRHTYGTGGGTWAPNYAGLAEDTDIEVGLLFMGLHVVHAFVGGNVVDSRSMTGVSVPVGLEYVKTPVDFRPLNDNQLNRDSTAIFQINLDNSSAPGTNKELRIKDLALWRATFALPGF